MDSRPPVVVLMATHNGLCWLPQQVDSILHQSGVSPILYVSDDCSTDGTASWLAELASQDSRVRILPARGRFGYAGANFLRLLADAEFERNSYVAFSDQDDVWSQDKLSRAIDISRSTKADAVSSNVTAFWPDGRACLINKAQRQRSYDYLFEAAGPGCTYLLSAGLASDLRDLVRQESGVVQSVVHHDWLCYTVCRALGRRWVIDPIPTVRYRQHAANEVGANTGWLAARARHRKVVSGWYRREVSKMCQLALQLQPNNRDLKGIAQSVESGAVVDRFVMSSQVPWFRRSLRDRIVLAGLFVSGAFWRPR